MLHHADRLSLAEVIEGASQDFTAFEVVGHRAIAEVDAVVVEQAVLARNFEVIGGGQDSGAFLLIGVRQRQHLPAGVLLHHRPGHGEVLHRRLRR